MKDLIYSLIFLFIIILNFSKGENFWLFGRYCFIFFLTLNLINLFIFIFIRLIKKYKFLIYILISSILITLIFVAKNLYFSCE